MDEKNSKLSHTIIDKWLIDYTTWDKHIFFDEVSDYMFLNVPESNETDNHLIAMLAESMTTYIQCVIAIKNEGIVLHDKYGNLVGKSPYVKIMHSQLAIIIKTMRELKLLPKDKIAKTI